MCHMSILCVLTFITMANFNNSIPPLPHTLHASVVQTVIMTIMIGVY